jgi:transposase, IS5 family
MKQQTLTGFEKYRKTTRRAQLLADMDRIIPWPETTAAVETVYPNISGNGGRPPIPLERMLRIYFLQLWCSLSDPAVEEALYDSVAMRGLVGIDLGVEGAPGETTVCKFRHLLERNKLAKTLLQPVSDHLRRNGIRIANGTIVDATIIGAPSSTKNKDGQRDPEMHQTAKGFFGMKAHVGVDSKTKLIHTILASPANVADALALLYPLHGNETRVWGDQACRGQQDAMRAAAPRTRLRQQPLPPGQQDRRTGQGHEPQQVERSRQRRAHDRRDQAGVRLSGGPLPGPGQEPAPPRGHGRARQSVHSEAALAECAGDVSLEIGRCAAVRRKAPTRRRKLVRPVISTRTACQRPLS